MDKPERATAIAPRSAVVGPEQSCASAAASGWVRSSSWTLLELTPTFPQTAISMRGYFKEPRLRTTPAHAALFHSGCLGRKTRNGFYRHDEAGKKIEPVTTIARRGTPPARLVLANGDQRLAALLIFLSTFRSALLVRTAGRALYYLHRSAMIVSPRHPDLRWTRGLLSRWISHTVFPSVLQ